MTVKKKIQKLADFKGLRVRVPGVSPTLKVLGAETVAMPTPELYSAIERGVVHGLLAGPAIITSSKLEKLIKYINIEAFGIGGTWYMCMNKNVWNSLPADIQVIIDELDHEMNYKSIEVTYNNRAEILAACKAAGAEIYHVDSGELKQWRELTANLFNDWVKEMDAKGLPGTQIKKETLRVFGEHGVDPAIR